jgi:AGZA family xanthine/uracil permease-like MFS transporter
MLEKIFKLRDRNASIKSEVGAGISAFIVTAYIIFINPIILSEIGLPIEATMTATCVVIGLCTIFMGLYTNYPFILAASVGLSTLLVSICLSKDINWQTAMAIIFIEGVIITIIVLTKLRDWIMNIIPYSLKIAIRAGTGILLAFIGLKHAGIIVNTPLTFVTQGTFSLAPTIIACIGLIIMLFLLSMGIKGGFLLGIVIIWLISLLFGLIQFPSQSIIAIPSFNIFGGFVYGIGDAINIGLWSTIFAFLMLDFFESMGVIISVGSQARLIDIAKNIPNLNRILFVDSIGAVLGGIFSCGSTTTSIEASSMGVAQGGKTGLTSVVCGFLFLISIFLAPIFQIIGKGYETVNGTLYPVIAPVLIIIGFILAKGAIWDIPWDRLDEAFPAFVTIIIIPLTFSIPNGIGWGFILYTLLKLFSGRFSDLHPLIIIISILFAITFSPFIPK